MLRSIAPPWSASAAQHNESAPGRAPSRTLSFDRATRALRDVRDARDVLLRAARALAVELGVTCVAYDVRDGALRASAGDAVDRVPFDPAAVSFDALRADVVVHAGACDVVGLTADGAVRGVIVLSGPGVPLAGEALAFARTFAAHVVLALANALAFDQLRRYAAEGAALTEAARTILGFTQIEPLAEALCRLAVRIVFAERACIYAAERGALVLLASAGARGFETSPPQRIEAGDDPRGAVVAALGPPSPVVVALHLPGAGTAEPRGTFAIAREEPFDRADLRLIDTIVSLAALAIRNVDLYESATRANQALAETNAFKDDLMAMFAHDFKGPLTVISGFSELLLDSDDPNVLRSAETIVTQTRRLAKLSDDALALAATQSAGFSLRRESYDIATFVRATVAPLDREGDRVVVAAPALPVVVPFDRSRMRHVIENVVGNAMKYSTGRVDVRIEPRAGEVAIAVADRGIGIPPGDIERIFSRFGRAANARSRGIAGSGVGLYIAKKIVEVHGGRLETHSVENEGSTFTVVLPA